MVGEFHIDGINITSTYGIFIHEGGFDGIVSLPEMKEPDVTDWAEENGIEVDLSEPKLKAKEFEIGFATVNNNADVNGFINTIIDGAYHEFMFTGLGITKSLRLLSGVQFTGTILNLRIFKLRFSEDAPMSGYVYQEPVGGRYGLQGYKLDGIDLSQYGIAVLEGTDAEILKIPEFKRGLEKTNSVTSGLVADPDYMKMKSKDVRLNLLMTASNAASFFRNLNALIHNLISPDEKEFYFSKNDEVYKCYYKGSTVNEFSLSGFWFEFSLVLCFISYGIKKYIYFVTSGGYLKAIDTSFTPNDGIIIFSKIDSGTQISDVVGFSKTFENGVLTITATSTIKDIDMTYSNGKLYIQ